MLDFGTLTQGTGLLTADLRFSNDIPASEPGDLLDISFAGGTPDFGLQGFTSHLNLTPGSFFDVFVTLDLSSPFGSLDDRLLVDSLGHNASGFSGLLPEITLELHGQIVHGGQVPEPQTWELVAAGLAVCCLMKLRRRRVGNTPR